MPELQDIDPGKLIERLKKVVEIPRKAYLCSLTETQYNFGRKRNRLIKYAAKDLGLPGFTGHQLRSGLAIGLMAIGIDEPEILNYIGWDSWESLNRYRKGISKTDLISDRLKCLDFNEGICIGEKLQLMRLASPQMFISWRIKLGIPDNCFITHETTNTLRASPTPSKKNTSKTSRHIFFFKF